MILSEARINELVRRPEVTREFPVLLATTAAPRRCGGCRRPAQRLVDYNTIRAALGGMPDERKQRFKELAGLERVRLIFRQHNKVVDLTF
jgi:hypothetical protein